MTFTEEWRSRAGVLALLAAIVLAVSACSLGGDDEAAPATTQAGAEGPDRSFPEFRVALDNAIDFLDPGLSYTTQGWSMLWLTQLPLLTYKHVDGREGATLIPALAEDLPEISSDGLTYRFKLRDGLKYSNGEAVKASDFAYTIERLFRIRSLGRGFFTNIKGAREYARTRKGHIGGIAADDRTGDITISLLHPQGDFLNVIATEFAALVPRGTRARDQSTKSIPATGPYVIEDYKPGESVTLVRNQHYQQIAGIPRGNPDKISVEVIEDDATALQSVIDGKNNYDFHSIPRNRLGEVQQKYADQLKPYTPPNTYYFFMNTRLKPFDKLAVRRAVNYAIDRNAIVRLYDGFATPTENVLPPTLPQYEKISMYPHNLAKAKQLVARSGYKGMEVTVWGNSRPTNLKPASYLAKVLESLGFKAKLRIVDPPLYNTTIGNQRTRAQTGISNWFQDYPHPLDWFDVLLNGNRITQENNNNYSNADVKAINDKIEALKREPELSDAVNRQWAEVDRLVAKYALWAPIVNRQFTDFFSKDMDIEHCYVNHVLYYFDYSQICKKS
jgi:peptide/nickel transport system substrate-binding protein